MNKIIAIFKKRDLRNKVLFILAILAVFRLISNIPIPSIDADALRGFIAQNQIFGLISTFTGGSLSTLSIGMLGLGPYITASIVMQVLTMVFPGLERMYKHEGEAGRSKFNQYSRLLTVPLAALQGYAYLGILSRQGIITGLSTFDWITAIFVIIAGSVFLMWLGELISEKNMGNGASLLILAGIVAQAPVQIQQLAFTYTRADLFIYVGLAALALVVIAGVAFISEAQRNIPVNYARRIKGSKVYGGVSTYLPLRVNNAGVIPIIFALSILLFPSLAASFLAGSNVAVLSSIATWANNFLQSAFWYAALYLLLVILFTYFYTAVTFDPKQISENIQKQGGYISGIRPGQPTSAFLSFLLNRINLVGAIFLGIIAILPNIVQSATGITAFAIGGTSILIVVAVALETMKQIDAQLSMYEY